jgi:hypothetical protein
MRELEDHGAHVSVRIQVATRRGLAVGGSMVDSAGAPGPRPAAKRAASQVAPAHTESQSWQLISLPVLKHARSPALAAAYSASALTTEATSTSSRLCSDSDSAY